MDIKRVIANNIKILRTNNNLTQQEFADKLSINFTRGHISRIELGIHVPSAEFIKAVSDAFNVSSDWLIGTTGKDIPDFPDIPVISNVTNSEIELLFILRSLPVNIQNDILSLMKSISKSQIK